MCPRYVVAGIWSIANKALSSPNSCCREEHIIYPSCSSDNYHPILIAAKLSIIQTLQYTSTSKESIMVNISTIRGRKLTRGQCLAVAVGLATMGLIGLQLTSDPNLDNSNNYIEQDADYDTLRRQLKVELEMEERYSDEMPKHLRNLRDMREVCSSVYDPSRGLYGCINITDPTASPTPAPSSAPIDNETAYLLSLVPADNCEMQAVLGPGEIPTDVDYINTIIVGYPGADKRIVLRQAEALTGLSGRDSWDMKFLGITRQPYIKTNYPHHEGIWGKFCFLVCN